MRQAERLRYGSGADLCLMYLILYVDRVNISTAAPLIKADLGIQYPAGAGVFGLRLSVRAFQLVGGWIGDKLGARLTLFGLLRDRSATAC